VPGLPTNIRQISAGISHYCATTQTDEVWCWGVNYSGVIGNGKIYDQGAPAGGVFDGSSTAPVKVLTGAKKVAVGGAHSCALLNSGSVMCWGEDIDGQLGFAGSPFRVPGGTIKVALTPTAVSGIQGGVDIFAGHDQTCVLSADNRAKCWGNNNAGQVTAVTDGTSIYSPVDSGVSDIKKVALSYGFTAFLTNSGRVFMRGNNTFGQFGNGGDQPLLANSPPLPSSPQPFEVTNTAGGVTDIAVSGNATCAVVSGGRVQCWGENNSTCALSAAGFGCALASGQGDNKMYSPKFIKMNGADLTGVAAFYNSPFLFPIAKRQSGDYLTWGINKAKLVSGAYYLDAPQVAPILQGASEVRGQETMGCGLYNGTVKCFAAFINDSPTRRVIFGVP
jgi:alpha-tubulin suppressor-like RCC1 family protein